MRKLTSYSFMFAYAVRHLFKRCHQSKTKLFFTAFALLSTPMGVDYVVIGFDMEVQLLVTHNAA